MGNSNLHPIFKEICDSHFNTHKESLTPINNSESEYYGCAHLIASFHADSFTDHYYKCLDCGEKIKA